jgi:TatA/E family protein of Tat protein translocase
MSVGAPEIIIVLIIALLVFGPSRLPQMGKSLGKGLREFRKAAETAKTELGLGEVTDQINEVKSTFTEPLKGVTDTFSDLKSSVDLKTDIESAGGVAATVTGAGALAGATPAAESPSAAGAFVEGPETPAVTPQTVFSDVPRAPAPPQEPAAEAPGETPEAPVAPMSPEGAVPAGSPAGPATGA